MKLNMKHPIKSAVLYWLMSFLLLTASACGPTFDDDSKNILKKPEILAVTLDPPEAAPGDTVRASFLAADQFGAISKPVEDGTGLLQVWMLSEPGASAFASAAADNGSVGSSGEENGDTSETQAPVMENIGILPDYDFTVYDSAEYTFNQDGLAPQLLSLIFFPRGVDPAALQNENAYGEIQKMIESGLAQMTLRTLVVSNRSTQNRNPRITAASAGINESAMQELVFLSSASPEDIAKARNKAAASPYEIKYAKNLRLHLSITVEDDGDPEDELLYQWISNAGEFRELPTEERDWIVPEYVEPAGEFSDQSGQEVVDPRSDPNLHPIWVIVRDNGVENQLGQSWVEFYVRVKK